MNIYAIKVALRGISPMIWRRLQLSGNTSLADLHHIIQLAMGWENDYLHSFHIFGKDYGIAYEGGLSFSDNPLTVILDDFGFDIGDRFHGNEATITVGDIRLLIEKYEAIRFNRQAINTLLSQPLSDAIYPC